MLDSLIKLIIKVWLVAIYFYITAGLTLWMVLAFLILAWPVLLVVGYISTRGTRIAILNSLLKLITVLGSSALQKVMTGRKRRAGSVPRAHFWTSKLLGIYTSLHLDFHTSKHLDFYTYERLYFYTRRRPYIQTSIHTGVHTYRRPYVQASMRTGVHTYRRPYIQASIHTGVHTYRRPYVQACKNCL